MPTEVHKPFSAVINVRGIPFGQPRVHTMVLAPPTKGRRAITRQYYPDPKGRMKRWTARIVAASMASCRLPRKPLTEPIIFFAEYYFPRPQRLLRKCDPDGPIPHTQKPDLSNLMKLVEDVLEKEGWYRDDKQICSYAGSAKWYVAKNQEPGAIIRISEVGVDADPGLFND